jgi:UDP-N-acetylglucosamine acyltransferase
VSGVHPSAIVDPGAELGRNVTVGPWTLIGPDVVVGDDCEIGPHAVVRGPTVLGRGNRIFQFATVGEGSPAFAYHGEPTTLTIGDNNVIREGVTIHRGLATDRSRTVIGSDCLFMAYVHIGHDCVLGDRIVMANNASVAGHVSVGDEAWLSGYAGVPQFRSIGAYSFVGGLARVTKDVPAYVSVDGNPAVAMGLNTERLRRLGLDDTVKKALHDAYYTVYRRSLTLKDALAQLQETAAEVPEVGCFVRSIEASEHGIVRERRRQ